MKQVGRNKSAQFRHCQLPEKHENPCRNGAYLFRPTFCLAFGQGKLATGNGTETKEHQDEGIA